MKLPKSIRPYLAAALIAGTVGCGKQSDSNEQIYFAKSKPVMFNESYSNAITSFWDISNDGQIDVISVKKEFGSGNIELIVAYDPKQIGNNPGQWRNCDFIIQKDAKIMIQGQVNIATMIAESKKQIDNSLGNFIKSLEKQEKTQ